MRSRSSEARLDRDAPAHAVAGHVRVLDSERVHRLEHRAREPGRVVGSADRLVGLAEAREVDRDHAVVVRERVHGREEGRLGAAEAVHADDRLGAGARGQHGDCAEPARAEPVELEPAGLGRRRSWRRGSRRRRGGCRAGCSRPARNASMPPRRSAAMRAQVAASAREDGVGLGALVRAAKPKPASGDHRVARLPARDGEPHASAASGQVDHVRVEPVRQRLDRVRRRAALPVAVAIT